MSNSGPNPTRAEAVSAPKPPGLVRPLVVGTLGAGLATILARIPATIAVRSFGDRANAMGTFAVDAASLLPHVYVLSVLVWVVGSISLVWSMLDRGANARERLGLEFAELRASEWVSGLLAVVGLKGFMTGFQFVLEAISWIPHSAVHSGPPDSGPTGYVLMMMPWSAAAKTVGDELLFRGFVQRGLIQRWAPGAAILVSSLCFAIWQGWPRKITSLPVSLYLGWLAWRTDSTWTSVAIAAVSSMSVSLVFFLAGGQFHWIAYSTNGTVVLLFVLGAVAFLAGSRALARSLAKRDHARAERIAAEME